MVVPPVRVGWGMNPKRRTGYGVWDITRQVARRIQLERERVESPAWPLPRVLPFSVVPRPPTQPRPPERQRLVA